MLWVIQQQFVRGARRLTTDDEFLLEHVFDIAVGKVPAREPLALTVAEGRKETDWVGTDFGLVVISPRVVAALSDVDATGWTTAPIAVDSDGWDGYAALVVTGATGPLDEGRSEATWSEATEYTKSMPVYRGLGIDTGTWDGSDVATPEDSAFVLVTPRVKDALGSTTNVTFVRESELELPRYLD